MEKQFKTIEEQIQILKNRKLIINDIEIAQDILINNNYYYLINGYKDLFIESINDIEYFKNNVTLEDIYSLYEFDSNLRIIFLKYILLIERKIDTYIAYEFSKSYGHKDYLIENNFENSNTNNSKIKSLIDDINANVVKQCNNGNKMLLHYINNYEYIPLWVLIRILTFGQVSKFYRLLKQKEANAVSKRFNIDYKTLRIYLINLAVVRNICAHDEKLYDLKLKYKISPTQYHNLLQLNQFKGNYITGIKDLFSIVIILKELLSKKDFSNFYHLLITNIKKLKKNIKSISIEAILYKMGFPKNYRQLLDL